MNPDHLTSRWLVRSRCDMTKAIPDSRLETLIYLRERARLAHLDGNGILVNHLAAIALEEMKKPQAPGTAAPPVSAWAWAVVFGLFWLTDSYMLDEVEKALKKITGATDSDEELLNILRAYDWLVRQPLDPACERQRTELQKAALNWAKEPDTPEYEVLLTHAVELLWFRNPRGVDWAEIVKIWATRVSSAQEKRLLALRRRLEVQTSMVVLGASAQADLTVDPEWDTLPWIPRLWRCVFDCDFQGIDKILSTESPKQSANTSIARLFFDMRHYNRLRGVFGDPQSIGLTRRRLITTLSAELVFEDIREERASRVIADLYLGPGYAMDRFFGFTLAMLLELAALRRWDITAWCNAVEFQARFNAEIVAREPAEVSYADRAIRCAVGAFRLDEKDKWVEPTIARLEFLPESERMALVRDLLNAHPVQYHHVKQVIAKLGDAVPPVLYGDLANWSVRYINYCTTVDRFGGGTDQIEFLAALLAELPSDHEAWKTLWPIVESLFSKSIFLGIGHKQLLRQVLERAPLPLAAEAMNIMLTTPIDDEGDKRGRWRLICDAACSRRELAEGKASAIVGAAPLPEDVVCLRDEEWAKPYIDIDLAVIRSRAHTHLKQILEMSVMRESNGEFQMSSHGSELMFYVQWLNEDVVWLEQLLAVIDNPRVQRVHIALLLAYVRTMVEEGPNPFADLVAPRLLVWLKNPPFGIDPMARWSGVFSSFQYRSRAQPEIIQALAILADVMRPKLTNKIDAELIQYVMRIAAQPPVGVTGAAMRLTLDLAVDHPDRRPELFTVCQALLLAAQLRAATDVSVSEELLDGFRAPTWFASNFRSDPIPREIIQELVEKVETLVSAIGHSGTPRVRGQVAAFLAALKSRDALTPELAAVREALLKDPRASVRRLASGN
jgi:hypothetical protein